MNVILVGSAEERARLRASLNGSTRVVGEFSTLSAAETAAIEADGILLSTGVRPQSDATPVRLTASAKATAVRRSFTRRRKPDTTYESRREAALYRMDIAGAEQGTLQEPLTRREIQVLELLAEGLPNKAIGERLGISDQTVKFHVASISAKLGAANRTDAVRRAVRRGLITL
ncbi:MAG: response regulator transcription factor [Vicinamibacterales bacterium]